MRYTYDVWGNQRAEYLNENGNFVDIPDNFIYNNTSNINCFVAHKNPFRYRGYYYDFETGLYYLNSRYYDPELGRFINADSLEYLDPDNFNGLNLYAYCVNNPMMLSDENGTGWWSKFWGWLVNAVIAVVAIAAIVVVACGVVASGGLLGGVLLGAGIGALSSMTGSIIAQGGFANADPWQVAKAASIGAAIGAISGAASWGFGTIGQGLGRQFGFALSNARHLGSGIKFGKVFGTIFLMNVGGLIGNVVGGLVGGIVANYFANKLFGDEKSFDEMMNEGLVGEIPSWLISIFRWMVSKK